MLLQCTILATATRPSADFELARILEVSLDSCSLPEKPAVVKLPTLVESLHLVCPAALAKKESTVAPTKRESEYPIKVGLSVVLLPNSSSN